MSENIGFLNGGLTQQDPSDVCDKMNNILFRIEKNQNISLVYIHDSFVGRV